MHYVDYIVGGKFPQVERFTYGTPGQARTGYECMVDHAQRAYRLDHTPRTVRLVTMETIIGDMEE